LRGFREYSEPLILRIYCTYVYEHSSFVDGVFPIRSAKLHVGGSLVSDKYEYREGNVYFGLGVRDVRRYALFVVQ
jgi:hypothetical protein